MSNKRHFLLLCILLAGIFNSFECIHLITNLGQSNFQFVSKVGFSDRWEVCNGVQCIEDQIPE